MRAFAALVLLIAMLMGPSAAAQDQAADIPGLIERVLSALDTGDTDTAYRTSQILLSHSEFDALPSRAKADVYAVAGFAALYMPDDRTDEALAHFNEAEALGSTNPMVFLMRSVAYLTKEDPVSGARDMMRADRLAPGVINGMRGTDIFPVLNNLAQTELADGDIVYPRFVDFLMKRWEPENPFDTTEYLRFHAARIAVREDDLISAGRLVDGLEFASSRLRVQIERDFESFWIDDPEALQSHIREGAQNTIARYTRLASEHPGYIEPVAIKAQAMARLGDPQGAFEELEAARDQVFSGELINDVGEQMAWLLNDMAAAAQSLGDLDRAVALMAEAAELSEYNTPNISQRANLAFMLAMGGEENRALEELEQIDFADTSAYGEAVVRTTRVCANYFLGQTDQVEADLAALLTKGMAVSAMQQYAYACVGDRDRAAALLIERLDHPSARTEALSELQTYLETGQEHRGPYYAAMKAHEAALIARPDVAAAIRRAGRLIEPGVAF
jgi:tetratricopeptide (TPR) repeat protein